MEALMSFTREQNRLLEATHEQPRLPVRPWNMLTAIEQIQKCRFECEGGPLENNDAWRWIVMTSFFANQSQDHINEYLYSHSVCDIANDVGVLPDDVRQWLASYMEA